MLYTCFLAGQHGWEWHIMEPARTYGMNIYMSFSNDIYIFLQQQSLNFLE